MSLDDLTYELIQKYLDNELSESEKAAFETQLSENETLAKEVKLFQMLPSYIGEGQSPEPTLETEHPKFKAYLKEMLSDDAKELATKLDEFGSNYIKSDTDNETDDSKVKKIGGNWKVLRIAAAIVLLLGVVWFMKPQQNPAKLYSTYVQHDDIILNQRGEDDNNSKQAEQLFNEGNYKEAVPLLEAVAKNEINYDVVLALGIAYLEQNSFDKALEQFKSIQDSDAIIKDKAMWYEAVTYLKMEDKLKALTTFEQLQIEYPFYKVDETAALIKKLK